MSLQFSKLAGQIIHGLCWCLLSPISVLDGFCADGCEKQGYTGGKYQDIEVTADCETNYAADDADTAGCTVGAMQRCTCFYTGDACFSSKRQLETQLIKRILQVLSDES